MKMDFFSPKKVKSSLTILLLSLSNSTSNLSFGGSCGNLRYWEKRRNKLTPGKASTTKGLKIPPPPPPVDFSLEQSAADSLLLLPVLLLLPFPLPPPTPLALLELVFEFLVLDLLAEEDFLLDLASVEVFAIWFVAEEDIIISTPNGTDSTVRALFLPTRKLKVPLMPAILPPPSGKMNYSHKYVIIYYVIHVQIMWFFKKLNCSITMI